MKSFLINDSIHQAIDLLGNWLKVAKDEIHVRFDRKGQKRYKHIEIGNHEFAFVLKSNSSAGQISSAIQTLKQSDHPDESVIPLLVVPFMGEVGRKLCEDAGVSWLDLSGNANICAPGMRILIDGRSNRFKIPGRPSNTFAPKSSRIARWLLINADKAMSQREIARATNMDEGFTSRIVSRLKEDGLIERSKEGLIRVPDPDLLLDSWREQYRFSKHEIRKGHIAARSSNDLLSIISDLFLGNDVYHAATGLGAAWLYTKFSGFRIVTFYLRSYLSTELFELIGFREEPRGANMWLVVPGDDGVFQGCVDVEGIRCVHPVQVYLDLFGHPERAKEAASFLRQELLNWRKDA